MAAPGVFIAMVVQAATRTVGREMSDLGLAFAVARVPFAWLVMLLSLVGTALIFLGLSFLVGWFILRIHWFQDGWLAKTQIDEWLAGSLGGVAVMVVGWFIFPPIVTAVAGLFLEPLADRVERLHYPELPPPRQVPLAEQIRGSLRVLLRGLGWNLLALPFYLIPVVNLIAYALVNAVLLSREYFQVVALRHLPMPETKALYRQHRWPLFRGGLVLAGLFVVPGLNLFAPLLATAWMVHRVWRRENAALRVVMLGGRAPGPRPSGEAVTMPSSASTH